MNTKYITTSFESNGKNKMSPSFNIKYLDKKKKTIDI